MRIFYVKRIINYKDFARDMKKESKMRFLELEGVRGLAAVMVVLHHFVLAFFPMIIYGHSQVQHMRFEDNMYGGIFALPFAGTLAVAIFFVLSGFVLSVGFFQSGDESIVRKLAVKRYIRLMIPALATTLVCFVIIKFGGTNLVNGVGSITQSLWLVDEWNFQPTLLHAVQSGAFGVFMVGGSLYNGVLWTMTIEFLGSFLVFILLLLCGGSKNRWAAYVLAAILTFNTWYFAFVAGMVVADLYVQKRLNFLSKSRVFLIVGGLAALLLGAYPQMGVEMTAYAQIDTFFSSLGLSVRIVALTLSSLLIILLVLTNNTLTHILKKPRISTLGKYTFALYLVHIPVMYTVGFGSFLALYPITGYNLAAVLSFLFMTPVIIIATVLFEKYVDKPAVEMSNRFASLQLEKAGYTSPRKVMRKIIYAVFGRPRKQQETLLVEEVLVD